MFRFRLVLKLTPRESIRCVFQSKAFVNASKELPCTPEGKNPYDVLEITVTNATTLDDVSKQFRDLVVRNHPDQPGGSHERMSEVNAAYKIVKDHHNKLIQRLKESEANMNGNDTFQRHRNARARSDDELGRSGGVFRRNAKTSEQSAAFRKSRSLQEIESDWIRFKQDTEEAVKSMCNRYELAVEKGRFFRKTVMLNEITVRERWLRKSFVKNVWEQVHELRGELLRRGARSAQQSQLAEEMISFASVTQRKLNEDFQRLTQMSVQSQYRLFLQRVLFTMLLLVLFVKLWKWFFTGLFRNSLTVRFRQGILSH
ncbi:DnaJ domain [Trypanosoma melophagium]|uniref:DnaJ domain n=1 Tax=Trypanosoma melophagium TaxID=715481 RepID=UPI00351AA633|nr:DnaJ domain [Trypanosoma melophagium]